jgi:predicted GH43/DUF377 family glycosyl hydrolase
MKHKTLTLILCLLATHAICQTNWTYYSQDPVLAMDPETYVWGAYGQPSVIIHNDTIKMWYAVVEANDPDTVARGRIHYAWSVDGITWTKHPDNPVLDVGNDGEWDNAWLDTPGICWDGDEFKLYYYGDSTYQAGQENTALGLATSDDGIHWTKQGIVLEKGEFDDWDGHHVELPAVDFDSISNVYTMYYTGMDNSNYPDAGFMQIGYATSPDGYNWDKFQDNPVIQYGDYPSWNDIGSGGAAILYTDGIYEMWYSGVKIVEAPYESWDSLKVGYAVSLDGIHWIPYPENPVLTANEGDSTVFWAIDVIRDESENQYKLYFESEHWHYQDPFNPDTTYAVNAIFYATAPHDVLFSPDCNVSVSDDATINQGESTQLDASGGEYYQWEPANGLDNASIPNPIASPDETTTYNVLVVGEDCITNAEVTVTVESTHVNTGQISEGINMHPNPATQSLDVIIDDDDCENSQIGIYTLSGKLVKYIDNIKSVNTRINMSSVKPGVYVVILSCSDAIKGYEKIVVIDE